MPRYPCKSISGSSRDNNVKLESSRFLPRFMSSTNFIVNVSSPLSCYVTIYFYHDVINEESDEFQLDDKCYNVKNLLRGQVLTSFDDHFIFFFFLHLSGIIIILLIA